VAVVLLCARRGGPQAVAGIRVSCVSPGDTWAEPKTIHAPVAEIPCHCHGFCNRFLHATSVAATSQSPSLQNRAYLQARLAFTIAALHVLVRWHGLRPDASQTS
jgi:hypothetical protein